jgi:flagellar motor switch protein FliM
MSRLLSQDEVDALLESFESGDGRPEAPAEVRYDLRAPLVLAGERLGLVLAACDRLAPVLADGMTLLLASEEPVRAAFTGLVQQQATTVLGTLSPAEPLELIVGEDGEPIGGLSVKAELGLAVVERSQGGGGSGTGLVRSLSTVELQLLEAALARLVRHLDRYTPLAPVRSGGVEEDPVFGTLAARGGVLATALFRMTTMFGDAVCRLMMTPQLANRLLAEAPVEPRGETPDKLKDALADVGIAVEPAITGSSMRLADLHRLRPGQVVQLDVMETEQLALRANGMLVAAGRLRRSGGERWFGIEKFLAHPGRDVRAGDAPDAGRGADPARQVAGSAGARGGPGSGPAARGRSDRPGETP